MVERPKRAIVVPAAATFCLQVCLTTKSQRCLDLEGVPRQRNRRQRHAEQAGAKSRAGRTLQKLGRLLTPFDSDCGTSCMHATFARTIQTAQNIL